jgi:hypothetical protein
LRAECRGKYLDLSKMNLTGCQRKLYRGELHNLYYSPNILSMFKSGTMRSEGHVTHTAEMRNAYKIFVGNLDNKPRVRPIRSCGCNITMGLKGKGMNA